MCVEPSRAWKPEPDVVEALEKLELPIDYARSAVSFAWHEADEAGNEPLKAEIDKLLKALKVVDDLLAPILDPEGAD